VWHTAERQGYPYGTIVQLLILLGQRRGEIAGLQQDWINERDRLIVLPGKITKNGREHRVPYGEMTAQILERVPRLNSTKLLFPARGSDERPFNGWGKSKRNFEWLPPIKHWTLHDLRRTFATNLAGMGVPIHVLERLLNHVSGTVSGVAAIYNRWAYEKECREAMLLWEQKIRLLTAP
jgi:integrase